MSPRERRARRSRSRGGRILVTGATRPRSLDTSGRISAISEIEDLFTANPRPCTAFTIASDAAGRSLERVLDAVARARLAAISLAHEVKLDAMVAELMDLSAALSRAPEHCQQAQRSMRDSDPAFPALPQWWFAVSDALQVIEQEIAFLCTICAGQHVEAPAYRLCRSVVSALRGHHRALSVESGHLMIAADA